MKYTFISPPRSIILFSLFLSVCMSAQSGWDDYEPWNGQPPFEQEYKNEHQFFSACRAGRTDIVEHWINQQGFDPGIRHPREPDQVEVTALYLAAEYGQTSVVRILAPISGEDINVKCLYRSSSNDTKYPLFTPLLIAAHNGHTDVVDILFSSDRCDIHGAMKDLSHMLYKAVQAKDADMVKRIIKTLAYFLSDNTTEYGKISHEHGFIAAGRSTQFYISALEIYGSTQNGNTVLHLASASGNIEILNALLQISGIDINQTNDAGATALHLACKFGHSKIVHILAHIPGVDVNQTTPDGFSALHLALEGKHEEAAVVLIHVGDVKINESINSDSSTTPLYLAAKSNLHHAVNALIRANAQAGITGNYKDALWVACRNGSYDAARLLIQIEGADAHAPNHAQDIPLGQACLSGHCNIVRLLADKTSINHRGNSGKTPLHLAVQGAHPEVVHTLIAGGANPTICTNRWGDTGLHKMSPREYARHRLSDYPPRNQKDKLARIITQLKTAEDEWIEPVEEKQITLHSGVTRIFNRLHLDTKL